MQRPTKRPWPVFLSFALALAGLAPARAQNIGASDITGIEKIALHLGAAIGQSVPEPTLAVIEALEGPGSWCPDGVKDYAKGDDVLVRGCSTYESGGYLRPRWVYYKGTLAIFRLKYERSYGISSWNKSTREQLMARWGPTGLTPDGEGSMWSWADGAVVMTLVRNTLEVYRTNVYEAAKAAEEDADELIEDEEIEEEEEESSFWSASVPSLDWATGSMDDEWVALAIGAVYNQSTMFAPFEEVASPKSPWGGLTFGISPMFEKQDGMQIGVLVESGYQLGSGFGCIGIEPGNACNPSNSPDNFGSSMLVAPIEYVWVPVRFGPLYFFGKERFKFFWGYTLGLNFVRVTRTAPLPGEANFSPTTPAESREQTGWKASIDLITGLQLRLSAGLGLRVQARATYARSTHFEDDDFKIPNIDASGVTLETVLLWGL